MQAKSEETTAQAELSEPELREVLARAKVFTVAQSFFPQGPRLDQALTLLSEKLVAAFDNKVASELERYVQALSAVGEFLIGFNGHDDYALQFGRLAWGLKDYSKGAKVPFLKRKSGRRGQFDPEEIWQARAVVVVGIEALLRAGDAIEEILRYINRRHRGLHNLMTRESDRTDLTSDKTNPLESRAISFESSVKGWHYKFTHNKAPTTGSAAVFTQLKEDLAARLRNRESDPTAQRKLLRDTANLAFERAAQIAVKFKRQKESMESDSTDE